MEKKTPGQTIYSRIHRVSVRGILLAMALATGAGLALSLVQEWRMRDHALTAAVQAVAHALTAVADSAPGRTGEYLDSTVQGLTGIDLFALYDADGQPLYFYDTESGAGDPAALEPLDGALRGQMTGGTAPLLSDAAAPLGADHCAYAAVYRTDGSVGGYVMAGLYLRSIRNTALHTLGVYLLIGITALGVGSFWSMRLAQRIKSDLLGYEPDAFRDLFLRRMELLDALDEGLLAVDRDHRVIYLNWAAAELLSLDKDASMGQPLEQVRPQSSICRVLRTGQAEYNISVQTQRTGIRVLSDRMPVWRDGEIVGAVATFRNRSEVAELARELTGVQHIVEAMRAYTHEFMNKLHVILGLLQLGEYHRAEEYVLQLTQTRALPVRHISQCIAEPSVAALLIGKSCRAAELGIRLDLDPESRLTADSHFLPAAGMITILGNLIENAFDAFSNVHTDSLHEVDVSVRESEQGLILSVDDNACGMPEAVRTHIFERGITSKGAGHGTGLFLVKNVVDAYGGEIRVESTQGVGSSFIITFRPVPTEEQGE